MKRKYRNPSEEEKIDMNHVDDSKSVDTFFHKEQHKEVRADSHPSQKMDQQLILQIFKHHFRFINMIQFGTSG